MQPIDGCTAAAHVSYFFSDNALIFPITPSSPMAELVDAWAAQGRLNAFNQIVRIDELNHEGGAAGAVHGAVLTGSLATTYTASQGLLLMIPNLYKLAAEHLPAVFHVAARTIATHALSIHGDHSDIMAARQTGVAILISPDVQEAMDFGIATHLAAINAEHPVIHAFDGFRTSHTIKKVEVLDYEKLKPFIPHQKIAEFRQRALNPEHPECYGSCMGPPVWCQAQEADNLHYSKIVGHFEEAFETVEKITGRKYEIMEYIGAADATDIIIVMGSGCVTVRETVNYLTSQGKKVGALFVYLYRPFSIAHFIAKIPTSVKRIAVLDRCKEITATAEPLKQDVVDALVETRRIQTIEHIIGGRFGQSSKDFIPADVVAVYDNLASATPKDHFICSIVDDVTNNSLPRTSKLTLVPEGTVQCLFFGQGSDGTVGANKNAIKIIADNTPLYTQGYFDYDSFKAGGFTCSHLRFGPKPIGSEHYVYDANFTSVSQPSYWTKYNTTLVENCKEGSILLLNTPCKTVEDVNAHMPKNMRAMIAQKKLIVKLMDASAVALKVGLPGRINSGMQTAFFLLSGVLPSEQAVEIWKKTIIKTFKKKGDAIVNQNLSQVDATCEADAILDLSYPENWGQEGDEGEHVQAYNDRVNAVIKDAPAFIRDVFMPVALGKGEDLPVSAFARNGSMMTGTTKYFKRSIAVQVPVWESATCIQCNLCVVSCPHAVIRPYLATNEEAAKAPEGFNFLDSKNKIVEKYGKFKFAIQASPLDCTGCAVCVQVCPTAAKGTLKMENIDACSSAQQVRQNYVETIPNKATEFTMDERQQAFFYREPYFEYHGACAGCGETAYITHLCRMFGDRMIIANATGCSSIYGFSYPFNPYSPDSKGKGPAWANSLFEDNAEFGFGMVCAIAQRRDRIKAIVSKVISDEKTPAELKDVCQNWLSVSSDVDKSHTVGQELRVAINKIDTDCENITFLKQRENQEIFGKPCIVIIGGDGWAYDIGYGGLDHILASGLDFTVIVVDTEVYSNTGGQCSKATPMGAVARFAAAGKKADKKDLGLIAQSYQNCFVGSINLNANFNHAVKTMREAVEWNGPSLVLAYSPCIEHGQNMAETAASQKLAAATGYWLSYDRHPERGLNVSTPKPTKPVAEFLAKQNRFKQLAAAKPEEAALLAKGLQEFLDKRYERYNQLSVNKK
ncbi:Pyruvate-flavodoxin oxidoreductase 4 [Spironucleus salmonicida]|uniref:Pyruvate-flavodoxin oxidoreductase 4 n=1 Tax=Spironucleus salmonicida TaxID=348837 RepID=K7R8N0_9EUKA|nr:pyruvate-flavodoxin oxidoreductase 4 [Spironucleus salmonicida]KAH0575808.1 Pyruvate-flavodoxin oxidoreductase 4 [Spironucleus salmonicida]|eukprot:EST47847.1 Pyruvate-flavodoxin oxidoreductase 4 [Spironucleus salmonicida]